MIRSLPLTRDSDKEAKGEVISSDFSVQIEEGRLKKKKQKQKREFALLPKLQDDRDTDLLEGLFLDFG